jgi:caffeoyl-CoA O-methyltransferase
VLVNEFDPKTREAHSGWNVELHPFKGHGYRERAIVGYELGSAGKIDLRLAPALETLDALLTAGEAETFDFAFIDADKVNYESYYERTLALLRPGGLVAVDNTLWSGSLVEPAEDDEDAQALAAFNQHLLADERVDLSLLPLGDGLTLARKRG